MTEGYEGEFRLNLSPQLVTLRGVEELKKVKPKLILPSFDYAQDERGKYSIKKIDFFNDPQFL